MDPRLIEKIIDADLISRHEPPTSSGDRFASEVLIRQEYNRKTGAVIEALRKVLRCELGAWDNAKKALAEYDADPMKVLCEHLTRKP